MKVKIVMKQSCQLLLFDLDNTLFDRNAAMRYAMQQWDTPYSTDEIMAYDNNGYTDRMAFCNWLQPGHDPLETLRLMQQLMLENIVPDPAVLSMLEVLKDNYLLGIASNGSGEVQRAKLTACGLTPYFGKHIFISGETGMAKPAPAFFNNIIHTLNISPAQICMTGDDPVNDIQAAQQCGLTTCWVSHGRTMTGINPDIVIHHITDLQQWT